MSTRLLSKPGKVHELWDDLESLWFVLLFEGLHFVKHNKPRGIKMASIFNQADVSLTTGVHTGGEGKILLYLSKGAVMNGALEFESKPFTILIRRIYQLFKSLHKHYVAKDDNEPVDVFHGENVGKLKSCAEIERLLTEALDSGDWPEDCDKVTDQYPPTKNLMFEHKDAIASGLANIRSCTESSKRKREDDDLQILPIKRSRTAYVPLLKRIWSKCASLVWGRPASNP